MAVAYGNAVAYGSGAFYRAEFVYTVTVNPEGTQATIAWECRGYASGSLYDSTNSSGSGGDITSGVSGARTWSQGSGGYVSYGSGNKTVNLIYGSTQTLNQEFWIQSLADGSGGGARSTVNASVVVPARTPTAPSAPGQPTVTEITTTTAHAEWAAPASTNGAAVTNYHYDVATDSGFSTVVTDGNTGTTRAVDLDDLTPGLDYWIRIYATNSAGTSVASTARKFTTLSGARVSDAADWLDGIRYVSDGSAWVDTEGSSVSDGADWVTTI